MPFSNREAKIAELEAVLAILECDPWPENLARRVGLRQQIDRLRSRQEDASLRNLPKSVAKSQDAH